MKKFLALVVLYFLLDLSAMIARQIQMQTILAEQKFLRHEVISLQRNLTNIYSNEIDLTEGNNILMLDLLKEEHQIQSLQGNTPADGQLEIQIVK